MLQYKTKSIREEWINKKLLEGYFEDDIPAYIVPQIKIFLSSTFDDYTLERNYLLGSVYQTLRAYCIENYQMDFHFVEMRWGITDEMSNQQMTTDIFSEQVQKCHEESIGPSFIAFLSERYGSIFPKATIDTSEYKLIEKELEKVNEDELKNFKAFYSIDTNDLRLNKYKLRSKEEIMNYLDITEKKYSTIFWNLPKVIKPIVEKLKLNGQNIDLDSYLTSVTENEIELGLLDRPDTDLKCAAFFRKINAFPQKVFGDDKKKLEMFRDTNNRLDDLKNKVKDKLSQNNQDFLEIDYDVIKDPNNNQDEIYHYLDKFNKNFEKIVKTLIDKNVTETRKQYRQQKQYKHLIEIAHHSRMVNTLTKVLIIRKRIHEIASEVFDMVEEKCKNYINSDSRKPFLICGPSGCGKSTILASLARFFQNGNGNRIIITRFVGTSLASSKIKYIYKSIIHQLRSIIDSGKTVEKEDLFKEDLFLSSVSYEPDFESNESIIEDLIKEMKNLLLRIAYTNRKITIIIDSIDKLPANDVKLRFLIYDLPKNVKIIYSTINEPFDWISESIFPTENRLVIQDYKKENGKKLLKDLFDRTGRRISNDQATKVHTCIDESNSVIPLYIKLLFDITSKWTSSYEVPLTFALCTSVEDTIKYLFYEYEILYGEQLFKRCIFYITLFELDGIPESELLDILSIDDMALYHVFQYHHPPMRRFPITVWLRIKYKLSEYLTERLSDGEACITWYHSTFTDAAKSYYKNLFENSEIKDNLLMNIIEYFTEKYNENRSDGTKGEKKEFTFDNDEVDVSKFKDGNKLCDYRNTKPQKLISKKETYFGYNLRKLNHFLRIVSMLSNAKLKAQLLVDQVYFNYEFVFAKAKLKQYDFFHDSTTIITNMFNKYVEDYRKLIQMSEIFKKIGRTVCDHPSLLYIKIIRNLNYTMNFDKLSETAKLHYAYQSTFLEYKNDAGLTIFETNDPYDFSIIDIQLGGSLLFVTYKNKLEVINIDTNKVIRQIKYQHIIGRSVKIKIIIFSEDARIYYSLDGGIYGFKFDGVVNMYSDRDDLIQDFFVLNSNTIIVFRSEFIDLYKINDDARQIKYKRLLQYYFPKDMSINETRKYKIISNIPKGIAFTSTYLDNINFITFVILIPKKCVSIYRIRDNQVIFIGLIDIYKSIVQNVLFDDRFTIHHNKDKTILIRLLLYNIDVNKECFNLQEIVLSHNNSIHKGEIKDIVIQEVWRSYSKVVIQKYFNNKIVIHNGYETFVYNLSKKELHPASETNVKWKGNVILEYDEFNTHVETSANVNNVKAILDVEYYPERPLLLPSRNNDMRFIIFDICNTHFEIITTNYKGDCDLGFQMLVKTENMEWKTINESSYISKILKYTTNFNKSNINLKYNLMFESRIFGTSTENDIFIESTSLDNSIKYIRRYKAGDETSRLWFGLNLNESSTSTSPSSTPPPLAHEENIKAVHYENEYHFFLYEFENALYISIHLLFSEDITVEENECYSKPISKIKVKGASEYKNLEISSAEVSSYSSEHQISVVFTSHINLKNSAKTREEIYIILLETSKIQDKVIKFIKKEINEATINTYMIGLDILVILANNKRFRFYRVVGNDIKEFSIKPEILDDDLVGYNCLQIKDDFIAYGKSGCSKPDKDNLYTIKRDFYYFCYKLDDNNFKVDKYKIFTSLIENEHVKIEKPYLFITSPSEINVYEYNVDEFKKNKKLSDPKFTIRKENVYSEWLTKDQNYLVIMTNKLEIVIYKFPELRLVTEFPIQLDRGFDQLNDRSFSIVTTTEYITFILNGEFFCFRIIDNF